MSDHELRHEGQLSMTGSLTVRMRSYFSSDYLWAAIHFAEQAKAIEAQHSGPSRKDQTHRAYVIGAIVESCAGLEAAINEVFVDVSEREGSYVGPLSDDAKRLLKWQWDFGKADRLPVLDKYNAVLVAAAKEPFDSGTQPYQDTVLLIALRNYLMHYKPHWVGEDLPHRLEARLKGAGFAVNAMMTGSGNAFFPDHALGAGCAVWATSTVRKFLDEFCLQSGLNLNYQRVIDAAQEH